MQTQTAYLGPKLQHATAPEHKGYVMDSSQSANIDSYTAVNHRTIVALHQHVCLSNNNDVTLGQFKQC